MSAAVIVPERPELMKNLSSTEDFLHCIFASSGSLKDLFGFKIQSYRQQKNFISGQMIYGEIRFSCKV